MQVSQLTHFFVSRFGGPPHCSGAEHHGDAYPGVLPWLQRQEAVVRETRRNQENQSRRHHTETGPVLYFLSCARR